MTPLASPHQAEGKQRDILVHMGLQLSPEDLRNNSCKYHEEVLRVNRCMQDWERVVGYGAQVCCADDES